MLSISILQTGIPAVVAGLSRLEGAIRDLRPAWDQVVQYLDAVETKAFASEGGSTQSGRWAALDARYKRFKDLHPIGRGKPILQFSGRLMESLVGSTPDTVSERTQTKLVYGTRVPYATYHQHGALVPRRRFLDLTNRNTAEIAMIVARYLRLEARKGFVSRSGVGV